MSSTIPVSAAEVAELAQETRRMKTTGRQAQAGERRDYLERKVAVLRRIAHHGVVVIDERTANGALAFAQAQRDQCQALAPEGGRDA
jgi:hypothetical protein